MNKIKIAQFMGKAMRIVNTKAYYDFLLRVFSTPPPSKTSPSASPIQFDVSSVRLKEYGKELNFTMYKKLTSRTVILFAHGWGGSIQNYKYFFQPALDRNISMIGYDAPAHGASAGKRTHILEFKQTVKQCLEEVKNYEQIIVVGHSLGAAAATLAIMESPQIKVDYLFALAAPSDLRKIFDDYIALMNVSAADAIKIQSYVKQKIQLDFDADNWRKKSIPDHLSSVTLLHGKKDDVITVEAILSLAKEWKLSEDENVLLIDDIGHYNILKSPTAIEEVFSKINPRIHETTAL